jgi:hypothetical protein
LKELEIAFDNNSKTSGKDLADFERRVSIGENIQCHVIKAYGVVYPFFPDHLLQKNMSSLPKLSMRAISDEAYITQLLTMAQLIIEQEPTTLNIDDIIRKKGKRTGRDKRKLNDAECLSLSLKLPACDNYSLREIHI